MDVVEAGVGEYVDEAAEIWAEATAARDGGEVAGLELSRPLIAAVLESSARSGLLVARDDQGVAVGFAAIEPFGGKDDETTADLRYLGVRPSAWGRGVAQALLEVMPGWLRQAGFRRAWLEVYLDNERAVRLYERYGWVQAGVPAPNPKSGRLERRYELTVA